MPALRNRTRKARLEKSPLDAELDCLQTAKLSVVTPNQLLALTQEVLRADHASSSPGTANDMTTAMVSTSTLPHPAGTSPFTETPEMTMDIRNQAAIAEALTRANHALQSNRADNTKKAYGPKKKLWTSWCHRRAFTDGEAVTEGKLCLWLQEEVFKNGSQGHGERKGSMLSPQGVEGYIKPIIDLYEV